LKFIFNSAINCRNSLKIPWTQSFF